MAIGLPEKPPGFARGSVVVVHPGVQHSRELVRALHHGGLLSRFVTSFNGSFGGAAWLPGRIRNRLRVRTTERIPDSMVTTIPYIEAATWLARPFLGHRLAEQFFYASLDLFDRLASAIVVSNRPRIVVGFENSCRHSFRKAKSAGALCVLDAASVHHSAQSPDEKNIDAARWERINQHKDEELRLADRVVVLSTYARDTYAAAGVPIERITIIPPGVWSPGAAVRGTTQVKRAAIRFLFVGNVKRAKGVDLLLEAFARLEAPGKSLTLVGSMAEKGELPGALPDGVEYLGKLPRDAVFDAYANADVLVLPSRADGFGFVVAEAMGCGLPVIVSTATGAKDLVSEGMTGWIFKSGSTEDLLRAMADAHSRRSLLADMGAQARQAAAKLTWDAYGIRVREFYSRLLAQSDRGGMSGMAPR